MRTTTNSEVYRSTMGNDPLPAPGTIPTEPIDNVPPNLSKPGLLWWSDPPAVLSYGMAVLSVAGALIIALFLHSHNLVSPPASLFLCAVMCTAWYGGIRPGLLAVALSLLGFVYYFVTVHSLYMPTEEIPRVVIFLLSGIFVGSLSSAQRSATQSLRITSDGLTRTNEELRRTNEALQAENAERRRFEEALRRSEANLAEAQRLSLTGSFRWNVSTGEVFWSAETFRIYQHDPTMVPTAESTYQRIHPNDRALVKQTLTRALQDGKDYDLEHRLLMPDGSVKHVHVVAHAFSNESGGTEFVGAVMDVTEQRLAKTALEKAFDEIKKSEDRLRTVIDTIPGMVWSGLPDGTFDFVNQPWLRYLGCTWEELSAQGGLRSVVHPDDVEGSDERWETTRATGRHTDHELRMRRADGQYHWFLTRAHPLRDEQGNIVRWYGTATDITERKGIEESLRRSEAHLADAQRMSHTGSWVWSVSSRDNLYWSKEHFRLYDFDPGMRTVPFDAARERIHPDDRPVFDQTVENAVRERTDWDVTHRIVLRDGSIRHLQTIGHPVFDEAGEVVEFTGTVMDVTERKRAEEALRRQASLLEQAHDAIVVWEFPRTIVYWNRGAEQLYGFSRQEALGRPSHELLHTEHQMSMAEFEEALERDGEWAGELTHTTRDGRNIIVESRHVLMHETDGRRLVLETNRDITDRKRAEAGLREAQADLAHVSRVTTMGELTASLAHEVNQPITAAVTNAKTCVRWLAGQSPNIEEARDAAMRSAKSGTRAAEIISRIRLLFQKGTAERELVDINEVIREIIVLLRSEATRYSISVRTELGIGLPELMGDPVQLQQVFMNLLLNGIEAMKDVDYKRELFIKTERRENEQVLVSVRDNGVGLPPQVDKIFNAFFTTKLHGIGMGLSISRSIIESHGGRLWADGNSPRGATFYIALPQPTSRDIND